MTRRVGASVVLALTAALLAGCATVQPWQRGNLARRDMAITPSPALSALRDHVYTSREAAQGGKGGTAGGCGCN